MVWTGNHQCIENIAEGENLQVEQLELFSGVHRALLLSFIASKTDTNGFKLDEAPPSDVTSTSLWIQLYTLSPYSPALISKFSQTSSRSSKLCLQLC